MPADNFRTFIRVQSLEKQKLKGGRFDPIHVARKTGDERDFCLADKKLDLARFSQSAARAEVNDPVGKAAVHHLGQLGQSYLVAVQVNFPGRAVKGEIQNAVIALA